MINLEIYKLRKNYKIPKKKLEEVLKKANKLLKIGNLEISLAIVDDKTIRQLNKKYRFHDKVTDVLSFELSPLIFDTNSTKRMGEIVISYPEAKRQAKKFKESLQQVILRLFVHGLLHIVGYRHAKKGEREKMAKMELKIFK